jgi:uncharacterized protein YegL
MPRLMDTEEVMQQTGPGAFQFSGVRVENLGATEYTLVSIVLDISGSVKSFANDLLNMVKTIVAACKKSPRAENLLIRYLTFNHNIMEIHGFRLLKDINPDDYEALDPDGYTALYDASYDAIGATIDYSARLVEDYEFDVNGAVYIVTDGMNNRGKMTPKSIKDKISAALSKEQIESLITILIGLEEPKSYWAAEVRAHLESFTKDAELTQFIEAGSATPGKLAKLANFVSQSVSSQSQALGSGAPSQTLSF